MTTQRTGRTTASIEGGMISISDGWSLRGGSFSIGFAWVSGGKFSIPISIMPGADLLSSVALVAGAPTMSQSSAAGLGAGASVAGGLFTLTGSTAAAAISTPAASITGGQFSTSVRNISGGALTAGASINAGFAGGGPSGGIFSAGATMVGGLFAATQNGAQLNASASVARAVVISTPYTFARVALQIPGNGTNNSTSIVDVSSNALTITRSGSPVISTAASKYGGASVRLHESSSDRLTISSASLSVGSNDFWLETWLAFVDTDWDYMISLNHTANVDFNLGSFFRFGWLNGNPRAFIRLYVGGDASSYSSRYGVLIASGTTNQTPSEMNHFCAGRVNGELAVWFNGVMYQDDTGTDSNGKAIGNKTVQTTGSDTFIGPRCTASGFTLHPDVYMDDFRFVKATPPWGLGNFTPSGPHPTS
jgi:hypothetical protein